MKGMRNIALIVLSLPILMSLGGLAKYHLQLNDFIARKNNNTIENNSQSTIKKTEVYIVGSVHFETDSIKRDHLYDYLESLSPSVILYEGDSSAVRRIVKKTDYIARLIDAFKQRNRVEKPVVLKYLAHHPNCILLPYEWELKNQYHRKHDLRKRSKEIINAVIKLHLDSLLTEEQSTIIDEFLELNNESIKMNDGTLTDINNSTTDSLLKYRQLYIYNKIPAIAKDRKELAKYRDFIPIHMSYWDTRNKAMAQNILKQIEHHPNKKIVVLNGYYHRYYLIEELKPYQVEYGFTLNEKI